MTQALQGIREEEVGEDFEGPFEWTATTKQVNEARNWIKREINSSMEDDLAGIARNLPAKSNCSFF